MYMMNKLFLVVSFLLLNAVAWSQGYLRLQIPVNNGELKILADQGVAVDHGIFKEEKYFIIAKESITLAFRPRLVGKMLTTNNLQE